MIVFQVAVGIFQILKNPSQFVKLIMILKNQVKEQQMSGDPPGCITTAVEGPECQCKKVFIFLNQHKKNQSLNVQ